MAKIHLNAELFKSQANRIDASAATLSGRVQAVTTGSLNLDTVSEIVTKITNLNKAIVEYGNLVEHDVQRINAVADNQVTLDNSYGNTYSVTTEQATTDADGSGTSSEDFGGN